MMKKPILLLAILAVVFILASFPIRTYFGTMASDITRIVGLTFMIVYSLFRLYRFKE